MFAIILPELYQLLILRRVLCRFLDHPGFTLPGENTPPRHATHKTLFFNQPPLLIQNREKG